jgi:predicted acylesterase/phospholipase RssA
LKGRADHFDRHLFLHATITDDSYVEDIELDSSLSTTHIVFPGGGIFFYYQAGLVNFLREKYDLSTCTFSGASAGALTATLTAADVDFFEATDLALKLAADAGVWDRSGGLQGIWGPLIEEWLDSLLPTCIDTLQDKVTLLVTPVPSFGKTKISRFENRKDLIHCNMASVHLVSNNTMAVLRSEKMF